MHVILLNGGASPKTLSRSIGLYKIAYWFTQTQITQFRRMNPSQPDTIMALYYNTARNLEKMGIKLRRKHDVQYKADPFPAYSNSSQAQGCPIPKNWSR
jgi:hypothetical protein